MIFRICGAPQADMSSDSKVITPVVVSGGISLDDLKELVGFVKHTNPDVRLQAVQLLQNFATRDDDINLIGTLDVGRGIVSCIRDDNSAITSGALTLAVNFTSDETLRAQLVKAGVVDALMEYLMVYVSKAPRMALLALNNISVDPLGAQAVMQEGKGFEGLHATRLLRWLCDAGRNKADAPGFGSASVGTAGKSSTSSATAAAAAAAAAAPKGAIPGEVAGDDICIIANVMTNLSQLQSCRRMLVNPDRGLLAELRGQFSSRSEARRLGAVGVFKNLVNDVDKHAVLMDPDTGLFLPALLRLVKFESDPDRIDAEERVGMEGDVIAALNDPTKRYDESPAVRKLVLEAVLVLARSAPSRKYMRSTKVYMILRELHNFEVAEGNDDVDEMLSEEIIVRAHRDRESSPSACESHVPFFSPCPPFPPNPAPPLPRRTAIFHPGRDAGGPPEDNGSGPRRAQGRRADPRGCGWRGR